MDGNYTAGYPPVSVIMESQEYCTFHAEVVVFCSHVELQTSTDEVQPDG